MLESALPLPPPAAEDGTLGGKIEEFPRTASLWNKALKSFLDASDNDLATRLAEEDSVVVLLETITESLAKNRGALRHAERKAESLARHCFLLANKILQLDSPPPELLSFSFLADLSKVYYSSTDDILPTLHVSLWRKFEGQMDDAVNDMRRTLEDMIPGSDPRKLEAALGQLLHLVRVNSNVAAIIIPVAAVLDGLIFRYSEADKALRKAIRAATSECFRSLARCPNKSSTLADSLYAFEAGAHSYPTESSLVHYLINQTSFLHNIEEAFQSNETSKSGKTTRVSSALDKLKTLRTGPSRVKHPKPTPVPLAQTPEVDMIQISQIQEICPGYGSGFVSRMLESCQGSTEDVVARLLTDEIPLNLVEVDRMQELSPLASQPKLPPSMVPIRQPHLEEELTNVNPDKLSRGKGKKTAEDILNDKSSRPDKATTLALVIQQQYDSEEDERPDAYDVDDVKAPDTATAQKGQVTGPATAAASAPAEGITDAAEKELTRAYMSNRQVFDRNAGTRRGVARVALKSRTGLSDEAIEGWRSMLERDPHRKKRMETNYEDMDVINRAVLPSTRYRAPQGEDGGEESEGGGAGPSFRGGYHGGTRGRGFEGGGGTSRGGRTPRGGGDRGGRGGRGRGGERGRGANHSRRDASAKKRGNIAPSA